MLTANGAVPIEELTVGARVVCEGAAVSETSHCTVTAIEASFATDIVVLTVGDESVACTSEHPFWISGKGWVTAELVNPGDEMLDSEWRGVEVAVTECQSLREPVRVYDLTVSDSHTYFVSEAEVLVHNKPR